MEQEWSIGYLRLQGKHSGSKRAIPTAGYQAFFILLPEKTIKGIVGKQVGPTGYTPLYDGIIGDDNSIIEGKIMPQRIGVQGKTEYEKDKRVQINTPVPG